MTTNNNPCSSTSWLGYLPCTVTQGFFQGVQSVLPSMDTVADSVTALSERIIKSTGEQLSGLIKTENAGETLANWLNTESRSFASSIDIAGNAGKSINSGVTDFFDQLNVGDIAEKVGAGVFDAAEEGIDTASRIGSKAADAFGNVGNEFISKGGELLFNGVKTYLPWIVFSLATTYAVPYGVKYLYQVAEKNLSKPKLASEVKYRGRLDWIKDTTVSTISNLYKITVPATRVALGTKAALVTALPAAVGITSALTRMVPSSIDTFFKNLAAEVADLTYYGKAYDIFTLHPSSLFPHPLSVSRNTGWYGPRIDLRCMQSMERVAFGVGALYAGWAGYQLYQSWINAKKDEPKAIFNEEITGVIQDITEATNNIKKHNGYFQNLILHGPGGTGKTMVAKIIAKNANMNYVMMSGGSLAQHIKNKDHVTELNNLMSKAKNSSYPTILFIDEAESFCRNRDMLDGDHVELLNAFLNATGEPDKKLMLILATNRIEDIDEAILSRMDHKLHIAPPAALERKKILEQYIEKFFKNPKEKTAVFTAEKIQELAEKTEGFTGRMIFKMLNVIAGKKVASKDNKLTSSMIDSTLDRFIRQEKEVIELRQPKKKEIESTVVALSPVQVTVVQTPLSYLSERVSAFGNDVFKMIQRMRSNLPTFKISMPKFKPIFSSKSK